MNLPILRGKISDNFLQLLKIVLEFEFISYQDVFAWAMQIIEQESDFDDRLIDFISGEAVNPKIINQKIFERIGEQSILQETFNSFVGIINSKYFNKELDLEEAINICNRFCLKYSIKTNNAYFLKKKKIEYELEIEEPLGYMKKIKSEFEEFLKGFENYDLK